MFRYNVCQYANWKISILVAILTAVLVAVLVALLLAVLHAALGSVLNDIVNDFLVGVNYAIFNAISDAIFYALLNTMLNAFRIWIFFPIIGSVMGWQDPHRFHGLFLIGSLSLIRNMLKNSRVAAAYRNYTLSSFGKYRHH